VHYLNIRDWSSPEKNAELFAPRAYQRIMLATVLASSLWSCSPGSSANPPDSVVPDAAAQADLIVVARVLGLADSKPEAQARRHLEVHLIEVERTLKGREMRGRRLAVRPSPLAWQDGATYLIFLESELPASSMVQPVPTQPILPATPANVAAVLDVLAAQGSAVSPPLILWMIETSGSERGTVREFLLSESGSFEWRRRVAGQTDELTGRLARSEIDALVGELAASERVTLPDDAAVVQFSWLDTGGEVRARAFSAEDASTRELLRRVESLARDNSP